MNDHLVFTDGERLWAIDIIMLFDIARKVGLGEDRFKKGKGLNEVYNYTMSLRSRIDQKEVTPHGYFEVKKDSERELLRSYGVIEVNPDQLETLEEITTDHQIKSQIQLEKFQKAMGIIKMKAKNKTFVQEQFS